MADDLTCLSQGNFLALEMVNVSNDIQLSFQKRCFVIIGCV